MTDLFHFSDRPLPTLRVIEQPEPDHKPHGLWVSVGCGDDSWPAWCAAEGFRVECLKFATKVTLRRDARIVRISTAGGLDAFDARYRPKPRKHHEGFLFPWQKVAKEYDGIIIAPYLYSRRFSEVIWYYTWDCASGCIWNPAAIEKLEPVELDLRSLGLPSPEAAA